MTTSMRVVVPVVPHVEQGTFPIGVVDDTHIDHLYFVMIMRALCSAIVLCWTTLLVAGAAGSSPRGAQPTVRPDAVVEAGTFVAPVARHFASAGAPCWRTSGPCLHAAEAATLGCARETRLESAPRATSRVRTATRTLCGYDAAAPPMAA